MNTSLAGGVRHRNSVFEPLWRSHTRVQSLSAATDDFFLHVPRFAQKASDGIRVRDNASYRHKRTCKLWQRDVTSLGHHLFKAGSMGCTFALSSGMAVVRRFNCAGLPQLAFPPDPGRSRQFQLSCESNLKYLSARLKSFKESAALKEKFAHLIEALMVFHVLAAWIGTALGRDSPGAIAPGTLFGGPAYLNGYAAAPLIGGLIEQGMGQDAMSFMPAGSVSSIPAAIAVRALVKWRVFSVCPGPGFLASLGPG
ncbi:MAG: hypothetical protein GDA53_03410 [Rhodobacteraceae bacterium]|nr:hypothetical protein [Paracoccaceae bacterium]